MANIVKAEIKVQIKKIVTKTDCQKQSNSFDSCTRTDVNTLHKLPFKLCRVCTYKLHIAEKHVFLFRNI